VSGLQLLDDGSNINRRLRLPVVVELQGKAQHDDHQCNDKAIVNGHLN
jgi:hypothetical protein